MLDPSRELVWISNDLAIIPSIQERPAICNSYADADTAVEAWSNRLHRTVDTVNDQVLIACLLQTRFDHDVSSCFNNFFADCSSQQQVKA